VSWWKSRSSYFWSDNSFPWDRGSMSKCRVPLGFSATCSFFTGETDQQGQCDFFGILSCLLLLESLKLALNM